MNINATVTDGAVAGSAVTSPFWLGTLHAGLQEAALIGGVILVVLRIALALRDLWRGR